MSLPIILNGEVVVTKDRSQGPDAGYLAVTKGEKLEVLYVGVEGTEEELWIYAKRLSSASGPSEGWISRESIETCRTVDDVVIAARCSDGEAVSYSEGDALKVKQWGRPENQKELNQIFVVNDKGEAGWISLSAIERLQTAKAKEVVRVWKQVLEPQDLLVAPDTREEKQGGYAAVYEKDKVSVPIGLVVEVLDTKNDWSKVLLRQHICGWIKNNYLSNDFSEEPPPPPASKDSNAARPPKPARPAPTAPRSEKKNDTEAPPPPPSGPPRPRPERAAPKAAEMSVPSPVPSPVPSVKVEEKRPEETASRSGRSFDTEVVVEDPGKGRVLVATFGLECLDGELADRCHELGGGAGAQIPEREIADALCRRKFPSDVILDARMFPDPDAALLTRHSGRHHLIITRLCQHRNFNWWLEHAKIQFQKALYRHEKSRAGTDTSSPRISVAVYCRRGKHRSVAAACILKHIFEKEGFRCPDISHLSYQHWRNCCKMQCSECLQPPEELQVQFQHAYKHWCEQP